MSVTPPPNAESLARNGQTMRYRPLGKTGLEVSALSMGCMRLGEDQELNTRVVSRALELGVNYFETTRGYCGGQCQQRTAPGLQGGTTGVIVSGKAGISPDTTEYTFRKEIELQLEILGLTHFKFFQVGWFGWDRVSHLLKRGGVHDALRKAQDEGLVHHIGFTGHDKPENFIKVIETGLFDSITVPYNLIHRAYEPTIARAGELGVGVVAMCPVSGGVLATESGKLREALGMDMPTAAMALRFVLANPAVSTACSGMNTVQMVEENAATAYGSGPATDADFEAMCAGVEKLRSALEGKICTACGYCMPCPQGVNIPHHMGEYTNLECFGLEEWVRDAVRKIPEEQAAVRCNECGECEEKCPNDIPVRDSLKRLREVAGV